MVYKVLGESIKGALFIIQSANKLQFRNTMVLELAFCKCIEFESIGIFLQSLKNEKGELLLFGSGIGDLFDKKIQLKENTIHKEGHSALVLFIKL